MKIEDIFDAWAKDAKMDPVKLDEESLNIPILHSKWIRILMGEKRELRRYEKAYSKLRRIKIDWVKGDLSKEELDEHGFEPFQRRIGKADIDAFIESDKDIRQAVELIATQKDKVTAIEDIIKNINNRGFQINSAIAWKKFTHGYDG